MRRSHQTMYALGALTSLAAHGFVCPDVPEPDLAAFVIPEAYPLDFSLGPPPKARQLLLALIFARTDAVLEHETPIQTRILNRFQIAFWNCVAAFHPTYLDAWTLERPSVSVPFDELHTTDARAMCGLAAVGGLHAFLLPDRDAAFEESLPASFFNMTTGLDDDLVAACPDALNATCLAAWVECEGYAPFAVGAAVAYELVARGADDGWNGEGAITKYGTPCTGNCRPYGDTTNYEPSRMSDCATIAVGVSKEERRRRRRLQFGAYTTDDTGDDTACWVPLEEDDGRGYFLRQQHVTPHIGPHAIPRSMSMADVQARSVAKPAYDYALETDLVIERLAALDDYQKMQVEFFDVKLNYTTMLAFAVNSRVREASTYERLCFLFVGSTAAEHDSVIVAWNEKVRHSLIRPTTVLEAGPSVLVETFAGPTEGVRAINRDQVEPYIRIMPHAEFPSASGCICKSVQEYYDAVVPFMYGIEVPPSSVVVPAGSSRVEPGLTPAEDLTLAYATTVDSALACGQSRLDGGLHFTAAINASYALCDGLGLGVFEYATSLVGGVPIPGPPTPPEA